MWLCCLPVLCLCFASFKHEIEQAFPLDGSEDTSGDLFARWSGTFAPEITELSDAVAAQMHLLPRERALDMLSVRTVRM